jgi:Family of unknown function (DUF6527)
MKRRSTLTHEFVEYMPDQLKDGVLYVSIPFATVAHKCCCGCGQEVVTPLSPTDWKLIFNGQSISLDPSIGNWSFPCKSHYWIRSGNVRWAGMWTQQQIEDGRAADRMAKENYFGAEAASQAEDKPKRTFWRRLKWW